jgi:hypothetical protein
MVLSRLQQLWRRLFRRNPEPQDPFAPVRVPKPRIPGGLDSSIALEEPPVSIRTNLFGRHA